METLGVLITGVLIFMISSLLLFLLYTTWNFGIFKKMGVNGPSPSLLYGNRKTIAKLGIAEADMMWWREYGDVFGHFVGRSPMLVVADTEMLKEILVKQFNNFTDRVVLRGFSGDAEEHLASQQGKVWKSSRAVLSPAFTAGKLRKMDPLITEAGDALVQHIKRAIKENEEVDIAYIFGCYTVDVIASTAFGLKVNSQGDPEDKFLQMVSKLISVTRTSPILILATLIPFIARPFAKFFNVSFLNEEASLFFKTTIVKEMTTRHLRKRYVDFIQLMMDAHNDDLQDADGKRGLTSTEIIANCLIFFFAGYETTAATLAFLTYFLALNPNVQQKMFEEIVSELGNEEPGYDNVGKLQYMDMCINETMRMFPIAPRTDRLCVQETEVNGLNIPKGMQIAIPIWILHHSDKLWEDPEKFEPERFSPENKAKMNPYQFMPFGYGPRICIGIRLALTEIKIAMTKVLREFEINTCSRTKIPPKLKNSPNLVLSEDMWLKVVLR
ncbi:cytochrome P450 3A24-like [Saccostrea echinata]|uniref:cytochrome P450 3A24-like n=1 Tax=Saccostrea echinata TaxID=191078 RepID=UPI002A7F4603|nr:cytochrome P450 3A24-like [Saccostrea echinata]